jgi:hypothetical protein
MSEKIIGNNDNLAPVGNMEDENQENPNDFSVLA